MVDQLAGTLFPDGPAGFLVAPSLARLAERSTRFANAYTASPLCAPGRAGFMSGLLPSRSRVYDNAAEFASDLPTFAHHLRRAGYATCLSGKMHFVGPDQLHGFEERLTTDIYPADFGWTPDWQRPDARIDWWYHNLGSVVGAGVAEITNQLDYDEEVAFQAASKLYDLARRADPRPWCLTVSFTHPHDPYVARPRHWELYARLRRPRPGRRPDRLRGPGPALAAPAGGRRPHGLRHPPRARPPRPPRLLRLDLLRRREDRRAPRAARPPRARRRHRGGLPLRPRRHARRARTLVQDELLRGLGSRAADAGRPRARPRPRRPPGLDPRRSPDPRRPRRHRRRRPRPPDGRRAPRRRRPRPGADGVCRRGLARADGGAARRAAEAGPGRARSAAALRPRGRPARAHQPRRRPRARRRPRPADRRRSAPAGTSPASTPRCAPARPAAASSTRRSGTARTSPGTTSRCAAPRSATCATT